MALTTSNVTSGFIDLATYDELEKYMYGGADATAYFVRETRKATWFTQVPVCLNKSSGEAQFGQEWSASISRSGDYLLHVWLQADFPFLTNTAGSGKKLRWVQNLMHNLVEECWVTFNDLVAARFDSVHLDFWSHFSNSNSKHSCYNAMIGNAVYDNASIEGVPDSESFAMNVAADNGNVLPGNNSEEGSVLNLRRPQLCLPLPFFFTRDTGVALPTAALPYNDMRVNFRFRNWDKLLLVDENLPAGPTSIGSGTTRHAKLSDFDCLHSNGQSVSTLDKEPALTNVQVWGNYAIVSNDERKRMACAPRDILIEQAQNAQYEQLSGSDFSPSFNLRFSHAVKLLFFGLRNVTPHPTEGITPVDLSYYSTISPAALGNASSSTDNVMPQYSSNNRLGASNNALCGQVDPVVKSSLVYENTNRLHELNSNYYSMIQPFHHGSHVSSNSPGMHMYSYSLDMLSLDPLGSTNYGKITNVSLIVYLSKLASAAVNASDAARVNIGYGTANNNALEIPQKYQFVCTAVNNNIVRISGGALGFPVL